MEDQFIEDITYWAAHQPRVAARLMRIVQEIRREPFGGVAKPEPLKHDYAGCWARRLTDEDRVIYRVGDDVIHFILARLHYGDR